VCVLPEGGWPPDEWLQCVAAELNLSETGIPEDPVTGSAHTALAPLWSLRTGRASLSGLQVSERSGLVRTQLLGDRVLLAGAAVTVLDGTLVPAPYTAAEA